MIADEEPYLDYTFPIEQFGGPNVESVNALIVVHPLVTTQDVENYVAALRQISVRLQEAMAESQRLASKGIPPPRFILQATIEQMKRFSDSPSRENPLVIVLDQKMQSIKEMPDAKRKQFRAQAETIVDAQVYPAYKKAIALLQSQLPRSTDDAGIWRLEGGSEAYAYFLRLFTTTNLTADEIHALGLKQVETIERQMDEILRRLGRTEGSVKQRIENLQADLTYPNPASEESREQIMRDIDAILRDAQERAALLFDKRPKATVIAQPDEDQVWIAQCDVPRNRSRSFRSDRTTNGEKIFHGFVSFSRSVSFPRLLRGGLYAERLAAESGWYEGDLEGLLGQLNFELFRARRLVVDTGIHAKHWTRQQAIDYGIEPSEVERYVVWPGQACSYMIGELKIIELREKATKALGDKFSLKEFHNVVLDTATVPLDILERQVNSYVRSKSGKVD